jgi:hypothetical protein
MPCFPPLEIQVVIIISTPAITSTLAFISSISSPAKPTPPASPLNTSFPATPVNPIISSHRLRYYRDRHPRLLYQRLN